MAVSDAPDEERDAELVPADFVPEDFLVVLRFAIWVSSLEMRKRHFRTGTVPAGAIHAGMKKGTADLPRSPSNMVSGRRFRPFRVSLEHHLLNDNSRPLC